MKGEEEEQNIDIEDNFGIEDPKFSPTILQSLSASLLYMTVSIVIVLLNRFLLSGSKEPAGGFILSWIQFFCAFILILFFSFLGQKFPIISFFPPLKYNFKIASKVFFVSLLYVSMIGLDNKCLENSSVSGYQILRSLTILFNVIFSYLILDTKASILVILSCFGIIFGFWLGIEGDINVTLSSVLYGVLSSIFCALYSISVKKILPIFQNNLFLLIEYNTPIAIIILTPIIFMTGEYHIILHCYSKNFWFLLLLGGFIGFLLNIVMFISIKYTSPLTHNLSGTLRASLQTLIAYFIFPGESISISKLIGIIIVIGFSSFYGFVRLSEIQKMKEIEMLQKYDNNIESDSDDIQHFQNDLFDSKSELNI